MSDDVDPRKPLSARSVVLSLLLGAHPEPLTPAQLTRAGTHFGISENALRAAMTRAVGSGDVRRTDGAYALGPRLGGRQARQAEAMADADRTWDGTWEMAVVVADRRSGTERAALRETLRQARLGEVREGLWARPANLSRPPTYRDDPVLLCFRTHSIDETARVVERAWDLNRWARDGERLLSLMDGTDEPASRLAVAAHVVAHLTDDPLLPGELLPTGWPAIGLRDAYTNYRNELRALAHSPLA